MDFAKFLRTSILHNAWKRLLLEYMFEVSAVSMASLTVIYRYGLICRFLCQKFMIHIENSILLKRVQTT